MDARPVFVMPKGGFGNRVRWKAALAVVATVAAIMIGFSGARAEEGGIDFGSGGWIRYGRIVASADTAGGYRLDKGMQAAAAQISARYADGPLRIRAGLGVRMRHSLSPAYGSGGYAPMTTVPYAAEADLEFGFFRRGDGGLFLQAGYFPYDYMPESRNLGLYLLRGPVYPGLLTSGFETRPVPVPAHPENPAPDSPVRDPEAGYPLPQANALGFRLRHELGAFTQDLLFTFENEWPTYWDASPAYIASYRFGGALRLGGGVQFNHFVSVDGKITDPENENVRYVFARSPGGNDSDTAYVAFKGVKLMGNFAFDPKALWGNAGLSAIGNAFGPEDLKLYGEIAVLGLDRDRAHNDLYGPIPKRMPMMLGFNLPAFRFLDCLSLELEYYAAPWVDDPTIFEHTRSSRLTPIPKASALDTNTTKDNLKWSIYAARTFAGRMRISAQAASDHFRPGIFTGYGEAAPPKQDVPFLSAREWYWMAQIAFFF